MEANLKANGVDLAAMPTAWGDIPTFPAVASTGSGVLETFRELVRRTYHALDQKHQFEAKFLVSEDDFLKGVLQHFRS